MPWCSSRRRLARPCSRAPRPWRASPAAKGRKKGLRPLSRHAQFFALPPRYSGMQMNRTRINPLLAGVLVALAIPTGVVAALDTVVFDRPDHKEPPTTAQLQLPEAPLTGPVDPET